MNTNGLPPVNQIPPEYRSVLEEKYNQITSTTATDAEILAVLDSLIQRTEAGMVWDETGKEQFISVNQGDYWDESQISTEVDLSGGGEQPGKTTQIVAIVLLVGAVLFTIWYFVAGRNRSDETEQQLVGEIATIEAPPVEASTLLIGDELGERVKIGQPASLEVQLPDGRSITFGVVNAPVEDRQMPILDAMRLNETTAEWVAGTVVNQVYGLPPAWITQINPGSQVLMRTDTGAVYHFMCLEKTGISGQENELFAQNRPGMTLFPLPAYGTPIPVIWCPYNPENERAMIAGGLSASLGEHVNAGNVRLVVDDWYINEEMDGQLHLNVLGRIQTLDGAYGSVVLNLNTSTGKYSPVGDQYQATDQESTWLAVFVLPKVSQGATLQLEVRSPLGGAALVNLGTSPLLDAFITVNVSNASWNDPDKKATANITLVNTHPRSSILVKNEMFQAQQGGGAIGLRITEPTLPYQLRAGERLVLSAEITPANENNINLLILNAIWEIRGIPITN